MKANDERRTIDFNNGCFLIKDKSLLQGWDSPVYNWLWSKGFIRWRKKGVYKGVDWAYANICSKVFAPGLPGYRVAAVACNHAVTLEEFKTIYEIYNKYVGLAPLNMTQEEQDEHDRKWKAIEEADRKYVSELTYESYFDEVKNHLKHYFKQLDDEALIRYMKKEEETIKEAYEHNKSLFNDQGDRVEDDGIDTASSVAYCLYMMY